MRFIPFLCVLLILISFGCIDAPASVNKSAGSGSDNNSAGNASNPTKANLTENERHFIYDLGKNASPAVERTMAVDAGSPDDAHNIFGSVNLTINDCLGLNDTYFKTKCLDSAAFYLNDSSICDMENRDYSIGCFTRFAAQSADPSFCERINGSLELQAVCKRELAIQKGDASLCVYDSSEIGGAEKADMCKRIAASGKLVAKDECKEGLVSAVLVDSGYFGDTMLWLQKNHPGERVLSWWDYGSSLDCMGMRSVISNQDLKDPSIPQVANLLVSGNETRLADFMRARGVKYVMLDYELVASGGFLGGKFGALNYLSCVYQNKTSAENYLGESRCESDNLWETVFISSKPCRINAGLEGFTAYKMYYDTFKIGPDSSYDVTGAIYQPYYVQDCMYPTAPATIAYCKDNVKAVPAYCVDNTTISGGEISYVPYSFNMTYPNGDLMPIHAIMNLPTSAQGIYTIDTYHFGQAAEATLFFTHDKIWPVNGTLAEGYPDRTTSFYDSILYKGLVLGSIDGFNNVYSDPSGSVKVFELSG